MESLKIVNEGRILSGMLKWRKEKWIGRIITEAEGEEEKNSRSWMMSRQKELEMSLGVVRDPPIDKPIQHNDFSNIMKE